MKMKLDVQPQITELTKIYRTPFELDSLSSGLNISTVGSVFKTRDFLELQSFLALRNMSFETELEKGSWVSAFIE